MRTCLKAAFPAAALYALTVSAATDASSLLDRYLSGLETLRISFTQTLADSRGREVDRATGTLIVVRPGKFRWELKPEGAEENAGQVMVADGRNVWFYDRDLEQVTVKPVDAALSATPAMLLSGTVDVRENFNLTGAGKRDGLEWLLVEPRMAEADFRSALLGFDGDGELRRMIIEDKLNQTATLIFDRVQRNARVSPDEVSFTPPPGADVIGKPRA